MSSKTENTGEPDVYARNWDKYVSENFPRLKAAKPDLAWPGDEWGNETHWHRVFEELIAKESPQGIRYALEVGPGSGKYTVRLMDRFPDAQVVACDVSALYLDVLKERCARYIEEKRLFPELINPSSTALTNACKKYNMAGKLDALLSIDAMVHVDLHFLCSYWIEAKELLRPGGIMAMSVSDATSEGGTAKLIRDVATYFRDPGMIGKFSWISPDIVSTVLGKIGFTVKFVPIGKRDCHFVAIRM